MVVVPKRLRKRPAAAAGFVLAVAATGNAAFSISPRHLDAGSGTSRQIRSASAVDAAPRVTTDFSSAACAGRKPRGRDAPRVSYELRSLVSSKKYRNVVALFLRLRQQGLLRDFLAKSFDCWEGLKLFDLLLDGGTDAVGEVLYQNFTGVWPEPDSGMKKVAFRYFTQLWPRLIHTKVLDELICDLLPDVKVDVERAMESTYWKEEMVDKLIASAEQQELMSLSPEQRTLELVGRISASSLLQEYRKLLGEWGSRQELLIEPEMSVFFTKVLLTFERHVARKVTELRREALLGRFVSLVERRSALLQQAMDRLLSAFALGAINAFAVSQLVQTLGTQPGSQTASSLVPTQGMEAPSVPAVWWPFGMFLLVLFVNMFTAALFWYDKMQAAPKRWRVPEDALCFTALVGGWPAGFFTMQSIRHKTVKVEFQNRYLEAASGNSLLFGALVGALLGAIVPSLLLLLPWLLVGNDSPGGP